MFGITEVNPGMALANIGNCSTVNENLNIKIRVINTLPVLPFLYFQVIE